MCKNDVLTLLHVYIYTVVSLKVTAFQSVSLPQGCHQIMSTVCCHLTPTGPFHQEVSQESTGLCFNGRHYTATVTYWAMADQSLHLFTIQGWLCCTNPPTIKCLSRWSNDRRLGFWSCSRNSCVHLVTTGLLTHSDLVHTHTCRALRRSPVNVRSLVNSVFIHCWTLIKLKIHNWPVY